MIQQTVKKRAFARVFGDDRWSTAITFMVLFLWFLAVTVKMIAPFAIAVIIGMTLALLLRPIYGKLLRLGWRPSVAGGVVTIVLTLLVIAPVVAFTAVAAKQGIVIAKKASDEQSVSYGAIAKRLENYPVTHLLYGDATAIQRRLQASTQGAAQRASVFLLATVAALPGFVLQAALTLLACFFVLVDGPKFSAWINEKVSMDWDVRERLFASFQDSTVSVILATIAAAATQALLMFIVFAVLGVPGGFFAAGATFLFAWVPLLGSTPVWLSGAIYLYMQGLTGKMVVMVLVGLLIGVADNLIRAAVLKGRDEMHPLVSLVAIFGGISMFGILGVFMGPILVAILSALLQTWPTVHQRFLSSTQHKAA